MIKPGIRIAIIGRPNVGKSQLFNRLIKKRQAIVDDKEGVTRDRGYAYTDFFGTQIQLIDTGGIAREKQIPFAENVRKQAEIAMNEADALVFVVDGRVGITLEDQEIATRLYRLDKPVFVALNKLDMDTSKVADDDAYYMGFEGVFSVSAIHGRGVADLLTAIVEHFPEPPSIIEDPNETRIAVVGKPNVGKSTFINALLDDDRLVVSDIPGTTLDSVDVSIERGDHRFTFVDTAGLRRKQKEKEVVDKFSRIRTEKAIEGADIAICMIDASQGLTTQEKGFFSKIEEQGKGCILFFNKWDLVKDVRMEEAYREVLESNPFLANCPIIFGSAKQHRNLDKVIAAISEIRHERDKKLSTGEINRCIERAIQKYHPPMIDGKRLRIYYGTQVGNFPPTFVMFLNYRKLLMSHYERYLMAQFRKTFGFRGTPIVFRYRQKVRKKLVY